MSAPRNPRPSGRGGRQWNRRTGREDGGTVRGAYPAGDKWEVVLDHGGGVVVDGSCLRREGTPRRWPVDALRALVGLWVRLSRPLSDDELEGAVAAGFDPDGPGAASWAVSGVLTDVETAGEVPIVTVGGVRTPVPPGSVLEVRTDPGSTAVPF